MKEVIYKILLATLILAMIIGLGVWFYNVSDIFKNDKELFYKYALNKNIEDIKKIDVKSYEDMLKNTNGYGFLGEAKFNTLNEKLELEDKIVLNISANSDKLKEKSSSSYILNFGNEELLKINYLRNADKIGIKEDNISKNKYIVVENDNLKALVARFGIEDVDNIPDKIEKIKFDKEKIDDEKIKEIKDKYLDIVNNQISNNNFTSEKNVMLTINEKETKVKKYTMKITEVELYKIVHDILTNLKEDNETLQLYIDITGKDCEIEELQENIDYMINELEGNITSYLESNYITLSAYVKNGKTLKTEVLRNDEKGIEFKFSKDNILIEILNNKSEENPIGSVTKINLNSEKKIKKLKLNLNIKLEYNQEDIDTLETDTDLTEVYKNQVLDFNFEMEKGEKNNINITSNGFYDDIELYDFEGKLNLEEISEIEEFTDENSINLNSCSDEDFDATTSSIVEEAYTIILEKAEMVVPGVSLLINSFSNTSVVENPIYMVDADNETEISEIMIELNNALYECFNSYVKAYTTNSEVDISLYINEENIKNLCSDAKQIIFTDAGIRYITNEGKIYEGEIDTSLENGYVYVKEMNEVKQ